MSFPQKFPVESPLVTLDQLSNSEGVTFILSMHHGKENRFTWDFITKAIFPALDVIEYISKKQGNRSILITVGTGDPKFYSNGLDIQKAINTPRFFEDAFLKLLQRFLTFPIPTIAAINGHAYAGGWLFAAAHDYRIFRQDKGFLCMNEIAFGANLLPGMSTILRVKVPSVLVYRDIILEGKRYGGKEALENGLVDAIETGDKDKIIAKAISFSKERNLYEKGSTNIYGDMKAEMNNEILQAINFGMERPMWGKAKM